MTSKIRVADYLFRTLADQGIGHIFLVTGGGAMHLNDALGREPRLKYVCNHHEQASAIAAEAYARITGDIGVCSVTSGPGGINAINGVFGAWTDSVPMLVVSGQMKRETLLATHGLTGTLRQLGDQEVDIVGMVGGITKFATCVLDPLTIRHDLEKALYLARHGRPGPCWIDVPVDVQATLIDPEELEGYTPEDAPAGSVAAVSAAAEEVLRRLMEAKRPIVLAGTGIRAGGVVNEFTKLVERLGIPVATAWTHDLLPADHPQFCGRQGTIGTRAGNFNVQNADFVLILGARMCIRQISYNWKSFARHAFTVQVDVDAAELDKPTFRADLPVHADAGVFIEKLSSLIPVSHSSNTSHREWLAWCKERVAELPNVLERHRHAPEGTINQYHFVELLFRAAGSETIFACGDATACITPFQAGELKKGQRLFSNSGSASMGYDLPAAIGASFAAPDRTVVCLAGDGSVQMNLQELATVAYHKLPIKLFVLNNGGYLSIRSTQGNFFKLLVGEGPESGVGFPDMIKLAEAYGIPSMLLDPVNAAEQIAGVLAAPGPQLIVVELDRDQGFEPKLSSKRLEDGTMVTAPLEDMAPFLDREEFNRHMLVSSES